MDRMARHTKQPDVLRELFAALGNDPYVIAECLARPILAERLVDGLTHHAEEGKTVILESDAPRTPTPKAFASAKDYVRKPQDVMLSREALRVRPRPRVALALYPSVRQISLNARDEAVATNLADAAYNFPQISVPLDCADDTWTAITTVNAPDAREFHTALWTGSEMIVWGGFNSSPPYRLNTGGRYNPSTDSWASTSVLNAPTGRDFHSAVWTGTEMIIWGGEPVLNTGGRYNPISDSWVATNMVNAPTARESHTAVWTGSEMVVWGGRNNSTWFNSGGQYNPGTDSWTATSTTNAPSARWDHTAVWTGSQMIVWGGTDQTNYLNTGGRYNPFTDSWTPTSLVNAPLGRYAFTGIWSGSEMIVWGGVDSTFNDANTGGRYNPSTDSWIATRLGNAPSPRDSHSAVWTGSEMIVWGGSQYPPGQDLNTGGRYNPASDNWTATTTTNAPEAREDHSAVWTGSEMIIWGGFNTSPPYYLNTGGRYCVQSPLWRKAPSRERSTAQLALSISRCHFLATWESNAAAAEPQTIIR